MKTWDENRAVINQFWPTDWNPEEMKLMREDLSPLDQDMLYDAIRNAKRKHDTPFVHLKWLLDEYRELSTLKRAAMRTAMPKEERVLMSFSEDEDGRIAQEFIDWIDEAQPSDYQTIYDAIFTPESFNKTTSKTALRLVAYAKSRLLGIEPQFSRVTKDGDVSVLSAPLPSKERITT